MASWATKDCNSGDRLPPTSMAKTTRRARLPLPTSSVYLRSLRVLAQWSTTPSVSAAPVCGDPSQCKFHTSVVSNANCDPPCVRQPIRDHFQSAIVCGFWDRQIPIPDQNVGGHSGASLTAHSSAKPRRPKAPVLVHDARWWPNESIGRPHPHMYRESGNGRRRRRSKMVLKRCGGIFVINVVGDTVNANPAPEPPWDRRIARSPDPMRSKRTSCLKWRSTLDAAPCCHRPRAMPPSHLAPMPWVAPLRRELATTGEVKTHCANQ